MAIDVCECDYRLVTELQQLVPNVDSLNYNPLRCVKGNLDTFWPWIKPVRYYWIQLLGHGQYQTECCKHGDGNGIYDIINTLKSCCGTHGAQPAGTCTHEDF